MCFSKNMNHSTHIFLIIGYIFFASTLITKQWNSFCNICLFDLGGDLRGNPQVIIPLYDSFSSVSISSLCKISYITPESFNKLITLSFSSEFTSINSLLSFAIESSLSPASVPVTKIKKVHASVSLQTHGRIHCHS